MVQYKYAEDLDEIQDDDYVIHQYLGFSSLNCQNRPFYAASIKGGKFLCEYYDLDKVLESIIDDMKKSNYFPNIFFINDHGNIEQVVLKGVEI